MTKATPVEADNSWISPAGSASMGWLLCILYWASRCLDGPQPLRFARPISPTIPSALDLQ